MLFSDLGLPDSIVNTVDKLGYTTPTPIQQEIIPHLLAKRDVVGQAQTGTGKTAAFALPLLSKLSKSKKQIPQILVLTPTRELAIQVADSFQSYCPKGSGVKVLPVFGGQDYSIQLKQLRRGAHIIVGTPGRVIDHIKRATLKTENLEMVVLDEADEMLRMGFLDDVNWILEQLPSTRQTALFSATMPAKIRKIAKQYLSDPIEVKIAAQSMTANTVDQRFLVTPGGFFGKVSALEKILETETFEAMLIFVRTKQQTVELADKINTFSNYRATALNGDIQQSQRQRTLEQLKADKIDILVATDVAARGLDVNRITHVINFDIPFDTEAYVHRIGRTGRAGKNGHAILFVTPRERASLRSIIKATSQKIPEMALPTTAEINKSRIARFKAKMNEILQRDIPEDITFYETLLTDYLRENGEDPVRVAAALAHLSHGEKPLLLKDSPSRHQEKRANSRKNRPSGKKNSHHNKSSDVQLPPEDGLERFRVELGNTHGVKPGNIVGAIANEADIDAKYIGRISIYDKYSTVDLPFGMPDTVLHHLHRARIGSRKMALSRITDIQSATAVEKVRKRRRKHHMAQQSKGH